MILMIHVGSSLQQLLYDVGSVKLYCNQECRETIPINNINRHSFTQQADHLTNVTFFRCMHEVFDELWIDFYGRNKRSSQTRATIRSVQSSSFVQTMMGVEAKSFPVQINLPASNNPQFFLESEET